MIELNLCEWVGAETAGTDGRVVGARMPHRAGDRTRTGDVQLGKLAFYH
jgi:hypothetical protein